MPSPTADLLDALLGLAHYRTELPPWGFMHWLDAPTRDLTVKYLVVMENERTSLQLHQRKDELLIILSNGGELDGFVEADGKRCTGNAVRIRPGTPHRVTGPLSYIEVSTYDDGTDTVRLEDDYGRA